MDEEQIEENVETEKKKKFEWVKKPLKFPVVKKILKLLIYAIIFMVVLNWTGCVSFKINFLQREKTRYTSDAIREELVKIGELATLQYNYTIVSDLVYTNKTAWIFSNARTLTVYLPPVKILSHELDESSYHEYLMKGNISTSEFNETRIDDKVAQEKKVEENGVKEQALKNAKDTLGNILKAVLTDVGEEDQDPYEIIFKSTEDIE